MSSICWRNNNAQPATRNDIGVQVGVCCLCSRMSISVCEEHDDATAQKAVQKPHRKPIKNRRKIFHK